MKLRKILLGLTLAGSLISHQVFALTPAEEVAAAKAAAQAAWDANYAAIQAKNAADYLAVYGKTLDGSTPVVTTPTVTTPTVATTPVVTTPIIPSIDISKFVTAEYTADTISAGKTNDDFLRVINASSAWARGYTGKGSLILIIDSGINATAKEFTSSIAYTGNFMNSKYGMTDRVGHGTSMAGIAAANLDGVGMVGVAPDAQLAIAKVTDTTGFNFSLARDAISWGAGLNADVANISANTIYDAASKKTFYQLADSSWANSGANWGSYYSSTGFYLGEDPKRWATALGTSEMVIVNSAGNSGLKYPENPAPMAYATRPDGSLYLNGQMLVVGAYDIDTNTIASTVTKLDISVRDLTSSMVLVKTNIV